MYGYQQLEVVPPVPIFWREGRAPGLGTQPMDWMIWMIIGFQGVCGRLLLPTQAAFCPTNKLPFAELRIFWKCSAWRFCGCTGEFLMRLWGVLFSAGAGTCWVRLSRCDSQLEGICYCAQCAGPACRHLAWRSRWNALLAFFICFAPVLWLMDAWTGLNSGTRRKRKWGDRPKILILLSTSDIFLLQNN